jgi:hypothetical protein
MGITQELAKYCHGLKFRQLPEEVVVWVKYFLLDFINVACRGTQENSSKSIYRFVKVVSRGHREGVIIGTEGRAPHLYSALANGTSAHAIEMDDVNNEASLHPGVVTFPAALGTGEMVSTNAKTFIETVVVGYDAMIDPVGKSLRARKTLQKRVLSNSHMRNFWIECGCLKDHGFQCKKIASALLRNCWKSSGRFHGVFGSWRLGKNVFILDGLLLVEWLQPYWPKRNFKGLLQSLRVEAGPFVLIQMSQTAERF